MTRTSTSNRADLPGNGAATALPFDFPVQQLSDLSVVLYDSLGNPSTPAYSVVLTGSGGTVTLASPHPTGSTVTIKRVVQLTQPTSIRNTGAYYPAVLEDALDRLVDIDQQQQEQLSRAVTLDPAATGVNVTLPTPSPLQVLAWNAAGDALTNVAPSILGTATQIATSRTNATATAGQTVFTVPSYTIGINGLLVWQNGSLLVPGSDYTETSTTSITLTMGASLADQMSFLAATPVTGTSVDDSQVVAGTRSQHAKNSDVVSVKDFGAKGDGVTDDSAAILAAVVYCKTLLQPYLILPAGTYLCNSQLVFDLPNNSTIDFFGGIKTTVPATATTVAATALVVGQMYVIATVGTTPWTAVGAVNNYQGTPFVATAAGTGTGTASLVVPAVILGGVGRQSNGLIARGLVVNRATLDSTFLGSCGVMVLDQCYSEIGIKAVTNCNIGVAAHSKMGNGGTSYTKFSFGNITDSITNLYVTCWTTTGGAGPDYGYTNENSFTGGHFQHSTTFNAAMPSAHCNHLLVDHQPNNVINNNKFLWPSWEDKYATSAYSACTISGYQNTIYQPRMENSLNQAAYPIQFTANSVYCGVIGVGNTVTIGNISDLGSNNYYQTKQGKFISAQPASDTTWPSATPSANVGKAVFQGMSTYSNADHIYSALNAAKAEVWYVDGNGTQKLNGNLIVGGAIAIGNAIAGASSNTVQYKIPIQVNGNTYYILASNSAS